jgi:hypothetical protein
MTDRGEVLGDLDDLESSATNQDRGRAAGSIPELRTLDAEAILRRLDTRTPGPARPLDMVDRPSSSSGSGPDGSIVGGTTTGSLPGVLSRGEAHPVGEIPAEATGPSDEDPRPGTGREMITSDPSRGGNLDRGRPVAFLGNPPMTGPPAAFRGLPGVGDDAGRAGTVLSPEEGSPGVGDRPELPRAGAFGAAMPSPWQGLPSRTIPIRDAFPPGLREDGQSQKGSPGVEGPDTASGLWESSRGEATGDVAGSRHGVSAEDLLKTNELLRQLVEETKRQRVASLPSAGPVVYPGR